MRFVLGLTLLLITAGSAEGQDKKRRCTGEPPDSLPGAAAPIYRDCDVDKPAKMVGSEPRLNFSPASTQGLREGCLTTEVQFVVDTTGVPEPGTTRVRTSNNRDLEDAVVSSVTSLSYKPAELGGQAVRQVVLYKRSVGVMIRVTTSSGSPAGLPGTGRPPRC